MLDLPSLRHHFHQFFFHIRWSYNRIAFLSLKDFIIFEIYLFWKNKFPLEDWEISIPRNNFISPKSGISKNFKILSSTSWLTSEFSIVIIKSLTYTNITINFSSFCILKYTVGLFRLLLKAWDNRWVFNQLYQDLKACLRQ